MLPGTTDYGTAIIGFTFRTYTNGTITSIKSSPITRLTIHRSAEPAPNVLEPDIADELMYRVEDLETMVLGGVGEENLANIFVRKRVKEYYDDVGTALGTDNIYLERNGEAKTITIGGLLADVSEAVPEIQISTTEPTIPTIKVWFKLS